MRIASEFTNATRHSRWCKNYFETVGIGASIWEDKNKDLVVFVYERLVEINDCMAP